MPFHTPTIAVRTGDTPAAERAKFQKTPADILITTPESLFLLLTSNAHESLRSVETVIIDEIHALVSTKRGAHLSLSLERLERIVRKQPLQRIGLSATQRPLDEVARYLGGASKSATRRTRRTTKTPRLQKRKTPKPDFAESVHDEFEDDHTVKYRPVTIVDASAPKKLRDHRADAGGGHGADGKAGRAAERPGRRRGRWRSRSGARFIRGWSS